MNNKVDFSICCEMNLALPDEWLKNLAPSPPPKFCNFPSLYIELVYGHGKSLSASDPTTHSLSRFEYFCSWPDHPCIVIVRVFL